MSVVERDDDMVVEPPEGQYQTIEPFRFLDTSGSDNCVLILLNQSFAKMNLIRFWNATELHICADGGANRLYDFFSDSTRDSYIPEFITGDFDSIRDEVKEYYASKGSRIIEQSTQYATDFMKAVTIAQIWYGLADLKQTLLNSSNTIDSHDGLVRLVEKNKKDQSLLPVHLYILSALGGRFDQTIHSISQLYKLNETDLHLRLLFITEYDVVFVLSRGANFVSYKSKSVFSSSLVPTCGLLPLGSSQVTINSYGLKYDVYDWESSMTTQVSSSNGLSGTKGVVVRILDPLVMNIEIDSSRVTAENSSET